MNIKVWGKLSQEEQIDILLEQAEWVIFQAFMLGLRPEEGSVSAVAEAKRLRSSGKSLDRLSFLTEVAYEAYWENDNSDDEGAFEYLNKCTLAYICYKASWDTECVYSGIESPRRHDTHDMIETYLSTLGSLQEESPLFKMMEEKGETVL